MKTLPSQWLNVPIERPWVIILSKSYILYKVDSAESQVSVLGTIKSEKDLD